MDTPFNLEAPLRAIGELLDRRNQSAAIVIVGGTALNLLGIVSRTTRDVDVIAVGNPNKGFPPSTLLPPEPMPEHLQELIARAARDFGIPEDWMNSAAGGQWETGLPRGFEQRVSWQRMGGLWIGLPGRIDLVFLKLYAAADDVGPTSRHFKDLIALNPRSDELQAAAEWIGAQDPSPDFSEILAEVIHHVLETNR
jgi:hypothetical protein